MLNQLCTASWAFPGSASKQCQLRLGQGTCVARPTAIRLIQQSRKSMGRMSKERFQPSLALSLCDWLCLSHGHHLGSGRWSQVDRRGGPPWPHTQYQYIMCLERNMACLNSCLRPVGSKDGPSRAAPAGCADLTAIELSIQAVK